MEQVFFMQIFVNAYAMMEEAGDYYFSDNAVVSLLLCRVP